VRKGKQMNVDKVCTAIYNFQHEKLDNFNMSFVNSVHSFWQKHKKISPKQEAALKKIVLNYKIDVDLWSNHGAN
jgi:hypothetical protein